MQNGILDMPGEELEKFCSAHGWQEAGLKVIESHNFQACPMECLKQLLNKLATKEEMALAVMHFMMIFEATAKGQ